MSKLKTMIPIAGVLALSVATVACAETTKAPAKPVVQSAKPAMPMEGKCGSGMKMGPATTTQAGKPEAATSGKTMEGKCGSMK